METGEKTSPWPLFVALGVASAEAGVLFGAVPFAVGGVLLFGWSCAGMAHEAGYAEDRWRPLRYVGALVGAAAAVTWVTRTETLTPAAVVDVATADGIAARAAVVLVAGVVLVVAGYGGPLVASRR